MQTKQVIVMRTDLNMRKGKMVAQGAHASIAFLTKTSGLHEDIDGAGVIETELSAAEVDWLKNSFTKVCVGIDSEWELRQLIAKASALGFKVTPIVDNGTTEFKEVPTLTCCAIGPDYSHKIDEITGHLKLL